MFEGPSWYNIDGYVICWRPILLFLYEDTDNKSQPPSPTQTLNTIIIAPYK